MSRRGEVNGWTCDECGATTYCVHVDDGVTPMFLGCRATEGCKGTGRSLMYPSPPVPPHVHAAIQWEWYSPDPKEKTELFFRNRATFDHVHKGGLLIRALTDAGREAMPTTQTGEEGEGRG